uniref:GPS domain-containing protein n=1 Tax=Anopheles minimus TaxID=112268 RepID=A0A182VY27_9DIPT
MKLIYTVSVLWWVISLFLIGESLAERPTFRIIAPEFICNPAEDYRGNHGNSSSSATEAIARGNSTQSSRQLTIGFQTNGGQRLHYRVKTYFTLLGDTGFISQRHTVGLWRAVRQLEQRVRRDGDMIAQSGQMTIGTDDLLPGVVYSFGVVAVDANGVESEEQNFTMTYRSVDQGASFEHGGSTRSDDDVSLLMLGAEKSYADVEYIVTAQLIFCRRRTDYYFRWTIGGMNETDQIAAVAMERSKMLRVPARFFTPGKQYEIQVSVFSTSTVDGVIAEAHTVVNILHRDPEVVLLPSDSIVGIDQAVPLRSYASGGEVMWSCQKQGDDSNCDDTFEISDSEAVVTFYSEGQYHVKVSIPNDSGEKTEALALLTVHPKVTPTVKILQWSQYPAVARKPFELLVSVAGLVPNCYSNWTIVQGEEGFAYFDPAQLPNGASLGGLFIRDIEENFLSELVDYGNDTVVKDVVLSIPEGTATGPWKGLEPDVRYKFRLQTVCPEPIDDSKIAEHQQQRKQVNSHWTFVLETNGAPEGLPIEVIPESNGTALKTMFKLSTGIAKDTERDYPLRYSFWYIADGVDILVATAYEITSAETVLPCTKTGYVGTYVIVCDSRNACTKIVGPTVSVATDVEPSEADISYTFEAMEGFFDRLNYRDALKCAFELLITLRNRNSPQYDSAYRRFVVLLQRSIAHIRKVYGETTYLSDASIQEFIMQAKPILDLEESDNHELFQQLLELMDPSMGRNTTRGKRASREPAQHPPESAAAIDTKLSLMESLTVSKNVSAASQARSSLLSKVHQVTKNYCTVKPYYEYVGQLITLEMNRYRSLAEVNFRRVSVPNKVVLSAPTGRVQVLDGFPETEYYCFGRIYYARDLFVEKEAHELDLGFYEAFVLSVEKGGLWTFVDWRSDYFQWSLDGRRLPNVTCQLWTENAWSSKHCVTVETATDEVQCNCTQMAYLRISNETDTFSIAPSPTRNTTTESAAITTASVTEPSLKATIVPERGNFTDPATTSWTLSVSVTVNTSDVVTATESDMVTLGSTLDNTTEPTERFPVAPPPPSNTSIADNGPSALLQGGGNETGTALLHNQSLEVSSIGYTIAGAFAVATLAMAVLTVIYRRRKAVLRLADELHPAPSRSRAQPSPHVRYARFQDEHNMTGDNVSTISDVLTI